MAVTKQILRLQSDQVLDAPQVGTRIALKDITGATNTLNLIWDEPAITDRDVTFKDPGANDAVVYENLAQTLANKTLPTPTIADFTNAQHNHSNAAGGGLVSHAVLTNLTVGDPHTQYAILGGRALGQTLRGGTGASENLDLESTANVTKGVINALDPVVLAANKNLTLSGTGAIGLGTGNITLGGGEVLGLPAVPSGPTAAASKAYVDTAISGGAAWRETLISAVQLDNLNDAIAQGVAFYLVNNPIAGDTFTIRDGTVTETWTFQAVSAAFQPAIGGTALLTMQNLTARINTDSTRWSASTITTLQGINPAGNVVVIYRKTPTAIPTDRIHGTFTTPADAKYVNYGGQTDYRSSTVVNLPGADPGTANFGFGRITSGLSPDEAHIVRAEDSVYLWNQDAAVWQLSGGAVSLATSAPGGGVIGQATYDSDKGLQVAAGVAEVKVDTTSITFNGGGQLTVAGGAVPTATSAPGGGILGKVTADEDMGLQIVGGVMRAKVDNSSISYDISGALSASGAPLSPTGLVSHGVLLTRDIPGVTPPSPGFVSSDIPVQLYSASATTGQLFDFVVPEDYDSGPIEILVTYQMTTAEVADLRIETQAKIVKQGGTVDTASFPATPATFTPPNSTNVTRGTLLSITNASTFQRGDTIQFYIKRLGADGLDTHTGQWSVEAFQYRYTGQVATRLAVIPADLFGSVAGETLPPTGTFNTDIPTLDYSGSADQASAVYFVVPDHWDGVSDGYLRIQYAMSTAAGGNVGIRTAGNIANVVSGAITAITPIDFTVVTSADTNPHRTAIVRAVAGSTFTKGSVIELSIKRLTGVGGNNTANFQVINATFALGVTPISGVASQLNYYLTHGTFGNLSGTIVADTVFPDFGTDFELFYRMASSSAAGVAHVAFEGRLDPAQTLLDTVTLFVKGVGASPQYNLKIYAEGSGGTPVYTGGVVAAPGVSTQVSVTSTSMSAQPTGSKRFFVVVESAIDAGEEVLVSRPYVKVS